MLFQPGMLLSIPAGHLSYELVNTVQTTAFEHVVSRINEAGFIENSNIFSSLWVAGNPDS